MPEHQASFVAGAAPAEVWRFIRDIEALCACIPGVQSVQLIDAGAAHIRVVEKVGVVPLSVALRVRIENEQPPHRLYAVGDAEHLRMRFEVVLNALAADATELVGRVVVSGEGPLKPVVDRLFERRAGERASQFARTLAERFGTPGAPERGTAMEPIELMLHPLHLGLGATAVVEPAFTGDLAWYEAYAARHATDGAEGRLVSMYEFDGPWTSWEMHPNGAEVVLCLEGRMRLWQEAPGGERRAVELAPGQLAINAPGVWHTADIEGRARSLFITAGLGTQHRPR